MKTSIRACFATAIAVTMMLSCSTQAFAAQAGSVPTAVPGSTATEVQASASDSGTTVEAPASASDSSTTVEAPASASDSVTTAVETPASAADTDVTVSRIHFANDDRELYDALTKAQRFYWYDDDMAFETAEASAADTGVSAIRSEPAAAEGSASYSGTNVRTEGVDEADVVKTDGRYIYILSGRSDLKIVQADGTGLKQAAEIHLTGGSSWGQYNCGVREFFISGDRLHILTQERMEKADRYSGTIPYGYRTDYMVTRVMTYDISDREHPILTGELEQEGSYMQARLSGGMLYLFTEYYPVIGSSLENSDLTVRAGGEEIPVDQICIPDIVTDVDYLVISSMDPAKPFEALDSKVLVSGAGQLYVSSGGIYAINVDYHSSRTKTEIVKFTYGDGMITGRASGTVRGTVNDTFSIDAYDGKLRVLTTYTGTVRGEFWETVADILGFDYDRGDRWVRHNALYILDEDMRRIGRIADLAEGEEIKSARFLGETGYFVTFRNTDPLFSVDLSNPASPKVLGALKIPGFSAYLHPMGEGIMLGMGYDADEFTGSATGLKLSLFDMADPSDVREVGRTIIDGITYCPAIESYRCIFADAARGLVGFYVNDHYLLYRVNGSQFERALLYDFFEDSLQGREDSETVRGLYIGDTFYVAGGAFVAAFDMEHGFEKTNLLRLA